MFTYSFICQLFYYSIECLVEIFEFLSFCLVCVKHLLCNIKCHIKTLFCTVICFAKKTASKIPDAVLEEVARALLPNILDFYESDNGKKEFEEWKKKNREPKEITNEEQNKKSED